MPRQPSTHVDDAASVGRRLHDARLTAGLSQRELSFEGCTAAYISRIEAGARIPSLQVLREIARRLGVDADYLATGTHERQIEATLAEADLAARLGETDRAETLYHQATDEAPGGPDQRRIALGLAEIAFRRGDSRRVVEILEPAIKDIEDPESLAWAAHRLGFAYQLLGEVESALAIYERALAAAHDRSDDLAILRFSTLEANLLINGGNVGRAEELLAKALNAAEATRDPLDLARLWWAQSRFHIAAGRPEIAARYARKAIDLLEATEHSGFAAFAYQLLAHIENDRGNGVAALRLVDRGEPAVEQSGNAYYQAMFSLERARALALVGETEDAGRIAMNTVGRLEEVDPSDAGHGYALLADVFRRLGDSERAIEIYELAAERLPDGDVFKAEIYTALGQLFEEADRSEEALAAYKNAALRRSGAHTH